MENKIIEAEFKVVAERTLEVIATEIRTIDNHVCQVAINGAIEIGQKLEEAKEKIGHGNWENWCKENLNYSKSKAERFMKISAKYGQENSPYLSAISKTSISTDFSIFKALALLAVPENEVEDFVENTDVEDMTVKNLEDEIKKLKEEKQDMDSKNMAMTELEEKLKTAEAEKEATYVLLQELQEAALEENNADGEPSPETVELQKKIAKLESDMEKAKQKEEKLKAEKGKIEAEKQAEIEAAKKQAMEEATEFATKRAEEQMGATVKKLAQKTEEALRRAMEAEKNLEIAGSETLTKRKVNMGLISKLAAETADAIAEVKKTNPEQAADLSQKTKSFILTLVELF